MKKSVMPLLTAALLLAAAVCTAQSGNPLSANENPVAKARECGPTFIAYNDKNLPVKTIELRNFYTGYSTTVYNPIFPHDFGEREAGVYVFIVTFDAPLEGSIGIKPDVGTIWCSGPKWEASWTMQWPSHACTPNRIKIVPDISCRE